MSFNASWIMVTAKPVPLMDGATAKVSNAAA
jgi:hypothetical protein